MERYGFFRRDSGQETTIPSPGSEAHIHPRLERSEGGIATKVRLYENVRFYQGAVSLPENMLVSYRKSGCGRKKGAFSPGIPESAGDVQSYPQSLRAISWLQGIVAQSQPHDAPAQGESAEVAQPEYSGHAIPPMPVY